MVLSNSYGTYVTYGTNIGHYIKWSNINNELSMIKNLLTLWY